eukprot:GAHX01002054.1.p1 GENE.GAHX01002054.1~~GAHX01002054.1.p1  ORF type:complete len:320 (-),score=68.03 GAHX01002054.1:63-1022(-)
MVNYQPPVIASLTPRAEKPSPTSPKKSQPEQNSSFLFSPASFKDSFSNNSLLSHTTTSLETSNNIYSSKLGIEVIATSFSEELLESFRIMQTLETLFKTEKSIVKSIAPTKRVSIKKKDINRKNLLILDLDETLVHSSIDSSNYKEECPETKTSEFGKQPVHFKLNYEKINYNVSVHFRPYLEYFLDKASEHFDIAVFTASQKIYADKVIDYLSTKYSVKHRMYRENCSEFEGVYLKDISCFREYYDNYYIVDNSPNVFAMQKEKGIYIESWFGDEKDRELKKLGNMLEDIGKYGKHKLKEFLRIDEILSYMEEKYGEQ